MKFFWLAALFGAAQMALTAFLTKTAASGKKGFTFLVFLAKLVAYVAAALLFVFRFISKYMYILSGCAVGLALAAIALLFYSVLFKKGEDD